MKTNTPSKPELSDCYDVTIVGSSFAGSLLGAILAKQGMRVGIVDRSSHPRFAIGESSTPTADFFLAYLADRWSIPELRPLAAYGPWLETYPEIRRGKKRGFTYFYHQPNKPFGLTESNSDSLQEKRPLEATRENSLFVAASSDDWWSDTHWLRSDIDCFLFKLALSYGCEAHVPNEIVAIERIDQGYQVFLSSGETFQTRWLIDSSGSGQFCETWFGNRDHSSWMTTNTAAAFAHFSGLDSIANQLPNLAPNREAGFHVDDSAQHHLFDHGWVWMLRFDHGVTSVGITLDRHRTPKASLDRFRSPIERKAAWNEWIDRYPLVSKILSPGKIVAPESGLGFIERISRCRCKAYGDRWISLPTTFGFVDPLHSTGIAHGLSGVVRLAEVLPKIVAGTDSLAGGWLSDYQHALHAEIGWIDTIVGLCYESLPYFDLFSAMCSLYFVSAIQFERDNALDPSRWPHGFLHSQDSDLVSVGSELRRMLDALELSKKYQRQRIIDYLRNRLAPWNDVGLLDTHKGHRIPHTSPPKFKRQMT